MKIFAIAALCIFSFRAIGQIKNVYCEYHVVSAIYKKDTLKFAYPQVITLKQLGNSSIIPLWPSGQNNYGIKLELLKSNVGLHDELILSKCFYIKEGDQWKEIYKSAGLQKETIKGNPCDLTKDRNWLRGTESGEEAFTVSYMQLIYVY